VDFKVSQGLIASAQSQTRWLTGDCTTKA